MAHPDLLEPRYSPKEGAFGLNLEGRESIFALITLPYIASQQVSHQLLAIADS
jgi:hypothetical protein